MNATQWFKNGDHPQDSCGTFSLGEVPVLGEGKVVRYFRSSLFGRDYCGHCEKIWHEHGWIDEGAGGQTVCPGDFIIEVSGKHYSICPKTFKALFPQPNPVSVEATEKLQVIPREPLPVCPMCQKRRLLWTYLGKAAELDDSLMFVECPCCQFRLSPGAAVPKNSAPPIEKEEDLVDIRTPGSLATSITVDAQQTVGACARKFLQVLEEKRTLIKHNKTTAILGLRETYLPGTKVPFICISSPRIKVTEKELYEVPGVDILGQAIDTIITQLPEVEIHIFNSPKVWLHKVANTVEIQAWVDVAWNQNGLSSASPVSELEVP